MHLINVRDLVDIGMPPGDAIRLREYAAKWWSDERRQVAKRPRDAETTSNSAIRSVAESTPPSKQLRFEKCFNDGGGMTIYRPAVKSGSWDDDADYTWWVFSKELKMYVPLPIGKVPVLDD